MSIQTFCHLLIREGSDLLENCTPFIQSITVLWSITDSHRSCRASINLACYRCCGFSRRQRETSDISENKNTTSYCMLRFAMYVKLRVWMLMLKMIIVGK